MSLGHVEYSGIGFISSLSEYASMILISVVKRLFMEGGSSLKVCLCWRRFLYVPGLSGFFENVFFLFMYLWTRATFRAIAMITMRLGWKVLIPVTLVWLVSRPSFCYVALV